MSDDTFFATGSTSDYLELIQMSRPWASTLIDQELENNLMWLCPMRNVYIIHSFILSTYFLCDMLDLHVILACYTLALTLLSRTSSKCASMFTYCSLAQAHLPKRSSRSNKDLM